MHNSFSAQGQADFAHNFFCEENIENVVRFMSRSMAFEAHGHNICSDLMFFHCTKSLCWQTEMVEDVKAAPEGPEYKLSHVFKILHYALMYTISCWVNNRDPLCRDLTYPLMSKTAIHL